MAKGSKKLPRATRQKLSKLPPKHQRYVLARAAGSTTAEAAREAGYRGRRVDQRVTGAELNRRPEIREAVSEVIAEHMKPEEVIARLSSQARVDIADFITVVEIPTLRAAADALAQMKDPVLIAAADQIREVAAAGFVIDIPKAVAARKSHLIEEVGFDSNGRPKLKATSSHQALSLLAKILGLLRERVEHTGENGGPIETVARIERVIVPAGGGE